jgi:iron(III) transport system permease protein
MWRWQSSRTVVVGLAVIAFTGCCLMPIVYLAGGSVRGVETYAALMLDPRQRQLLANTALLGAGTAALATLIGASLGLALARIPLPGRNLLRLALAAPVLLPPYIVALAYTYLGGNRGLLAAVVGSDAVSVWTYSLPAAILVLSLVFYPISMLVTEVALRGIDGRLEEAALLVTPRTRVLRRVTLPLTLPSILAGSLLIFVLAISEFGVPGVLRVRVYTTEVFTAFAALYDVSRAVLLAAPLLILCLGAAAIAALLGEHLLVARRHLGVPPLRFESWRKAALMGAAAVLAIALLIPLAVLIGEALDARSQSAVLEGSGPSIANSLMFAAAGATLVMIVAVCLGYWRARVGGRLGRAADALFIVTFAAPSTIVGVGLIGLWNRPGLLGALYGTEAMLILGYLARFLPVAALAIGVTARYVPISHEEAAAVSGAKWVRTMWRIVLPQISIGIAAAWVIAFILAFGELGVSIVVAPPGEATLPIRVYTLIANAPSSQVAALTLLQAGVVFLPLAVLGAAMALRSKRS